MAAWKRPSTAEWVVQLSWTALTAEGVAWLAIAMCPSRRPLGQQDRSKVPSKFRVVKGTATRTDRQTDKHIRQIDRQTDTDSRIHSVSYYNTVISGTRAAESTS